ncbi:MAG: ferredoxin family protein [Planctomycetes bacterium]|nr:ferredoxin family protein [Planctomycetota bacterium]
MNFMAGALAGTALPVRTATVVYSRVPQEERAQRQPEYEKLAAALRAIGIEFLEVESIYDRYEEDDDTRLLREAPGDLIFIGWHYPRALKWILARQGLDVNGRARALHCLDAREEEPAVLAERVKKILAGSASAVVTAPPKSPSTSDGLTPRQRGDLAEQALPNPENAKLSARWYPVVDYDACTNCMECLDFCLFGVYGVDAGGTLRVTNQDECRSDCPACARVCPVGAIVFPKYVTNVAIAGGQDDGDRGSLKLDLSKIFGKPKARHQAALERDRELLKAGRKPPSADEVEKLTDAFDQVDL